MPNKFNTVILVQLGSVSDQLARCKKKKQSCRIQVEMTLSGLKAQSQLCIFNTSQASSTTAMHQRISQATPRGVWSSTFLQKPIFPLLTMSLLCMVLSCLNFCLSFTLIKGLGVFMKQKEIQMHVYIL